MFNCYIFTNVNMPDHYLTLSDKYSTIAFPMGNKLCKTINKTVKRHKQVYIAFIIYFAKLKLV